MRPTEPAMSESRPPINAPPLGDGKHFAPRSEAFQRFMAAPLIVATVLMLATATLAVLAWVGGTAEGDRLRIELQGTCSEASIPMLSARMDEMGLGDPRVSKPRCPAPPKTNTSTCPRSSPAGGC
jgi:hypothetical protein